MNNPVEKLLKKYRFLRKKHFRNNRLIYNDYDFTVEWFYEVFGYYPNLKNPKTFNEKVNWIKLHDHRKIRQVIADKIEVREYVRERVGIQYLTKVFQTASRFNELDWEALPMQFVLKPSHMSGKVEIVFNKSEVDLPKLAERCAEWLKINYYYLAREWSYKHIKPRLIVEELLIENNSIPLDYKFYCFSGKVKAIQVDFERFSNHRISFYDPSWRKLPFTKSVAMGDEVDAPKNLNEMISVSEKLSCEFDYIRVDLFNLNGKIYFGELTNYPQAGLGRFFPPEYDEIVGSWWELDRRGK